MSFNIWSITIGFSDFYYLAICSVFTTEVFMPDSARWINALMRLGSASLAIADRSRRDESTVSPAETPICFPSNETSQQ